MDQPRETVTLKEKGVLQDTIPVPGRAGTPLMWSLSGPGRDLTTVLGWCFRQEQRDAVFAGSLEWRRWLAAPCLPCPFPLEDAPLSTHRRYSLAKLAPGRMAGPFLLLDSPSRWWTSTSTMANPQFPAYLKKCEFLSSPVAQPSPRLFLIHLAFVLRPGKYFRLEGLREVFQTLHGPSESEPRRNAGVSVPSPRCSTAPA